MKAYGTKFEFCILLLFITHVLASKQLTTNYPTKSSYSKTNSIVAIFSIHFKDFQVDHNRRTFLELIHTYYIRTSLFIIQNNTFYQELTFDLRQSGNWSFVKHTTKIQTPWLLSNGTIDVIITIPNPNDTSLQL